jgi:hypothetical protein
MAPLGFYRAWVKKSDGQYGVVVGVLDTTQPTWVGSRLHCAKKKKKSKNYHGRQQEHQRMIFFDHAREKEKIHTRTQNKKQKNQGGAGAERM